MEAKEMENANCTANQLFAAWSSIFLLTLEIPKERGVLSRHLKKLFLRGTSRAIHEQRESTPQRCPALPLCPVIGFNEMMRLLWASLLSPNPVPLRESVNTGTAGTLKLYFVFPSPHSHRLPINTSEKLHPGAA